MMLKYIRKRKEKNMNKSLTRSLTRVSLFAALMAVSALIYIPLPVPITLQTLVMFFALFTIGGREGSIAVFIYIALGAIGLPIFSGFTGGISRLFDATGGYIFGMLAGALVYWLMERLPDTKVFAAIKSASVILTIYLLGTIWYSLIYLDGGFGYIITVCVLPFIIPDAIKIYLAYIISKRIRLSE